MKRTYGSWQAIKTFTSHAGKSRFFRELDLGGDPIGYIKRQPIIPSPYAYSPTHSIYRWQGRRVFIVETAHKRYEVFEMPEGMELYNTEAEVLGIALLPGQTLDENLEEGAEVAAGLA